MASRQGRRQEGWEMAGWKGWQLQECWGWIGSESLIHSMRGKRLEVEHQRLHGLLVLEKVNQEKRAGSEQGELFVATTLFD